MFIYPKNFAIGKRGIEQSSCFILMPFGKEYNITYGYLKLIMDNLGISCSRSDDIYESIPILTKIIERILRSEFIIADLTSKNPNVFYELGMAHSFRDSESIILIAQSIEDVPFDIRHLPVILYKLDNKYLLEDNIKKRVLSSRNKIGKKRFLLDYFADSGFTYSLIEKVVDKIQERNPQFSELVYYLFSDQDHKGFQYVDITLIKHLMDEVNTYCAYSEGIERNLLYRFKLDILVKISNIEEMREFCLSNLGSNQHDIFSTELNKDMFFSAEYACQLVNKNIHKSIAINWLIGYLSNSRVGGIDVIRNKIDEFFISSSDDDIDSSLITLFKSESFTLREATVDILTQKKNPSAYNYIITNMLKENNVYVLRSMINGLARYNNPSSCEIVIRWFRDNKNVIKENNAIFLCDVAISFFKKLDVFEYSEEITRLKISLF